MAIAASVLLGLFNPGLLGAFLAYTVFLGIGIGVAIWMFSPRMRQSTALAFAPVIGFSLVAVIGSWLVNSDHPVQEWGWPLTLILLGINLVLLILWRMLHPGRWTELHLGRVLHEAGFGYAATLAIMAPIALGGLRFSAFRDNAADAVTYLSQAEFLLQIPYSRFQDLTFLFRMNPVLYWASYWMQNRWTTSMLMAYASEIANVPLYRFDFAFSALPFAMMLSPIFIRMRETRIGSGWALWLAAGIALGYYGQVVLDSRAVSLCTALPVLIALVLLVERIWEDKRVYLLNWPVYAGEAALLILLAVTLTTLYVEILAILLPGIVLAGFFFAIRKDTQPRKAATFCAAGIAAAAVILVTLPIYIRFFISQVLSSQALFVNWQNEYFQWLYDDFPPGILGLNPYQLAPTASFLLSVFAVLVLLLFAVAFLELLFGRERLETIFHLSALLVAGGSLFFAYLYFQGQLWQAGKVFTYFYPFLMISMTAVPFALGRIGRLKFLPGLARLLVLGWLVSQAFLGLYRLVVATYGFEYPYHVELPASTHTPSTYPALYAWNIDSFLSALSAKVQPVIWISTDGVYQDMYWAAAMPGAAQVFTANPFAGELDGTDTTTFTLENINRKAPDYLIISNHIWKLNPAAAEVQPVVSDNQYSLIAVPHPFQEPPWIIGIRSEPFVRLGIQPTSFTLVSRVWLEILSPAACQGELSENALVDPQADSKADLRITSQPARSQKGLLIGQSGQIEIPFPLVAGYNLIIIQIPPASRGTSSTAPLAIDFSASQISFSGCQP